MRVALPRMRSRREESKLPFSVHKFSDSATRHEYRRHLERVLQEELHRPYLSSEENWRVLKSCIVPAAEKTIGRGEEEATGVVCGKR